MPDPNSFHLPEELLIVGAAVQTGIIEELHLKAQTFEELLANTGCNERALWIVTEALVALGYLEHRENKIGLTQEALSVFYHPGAENYTGFSFMHTYDLIPKWLALPEMLLPQLTDSKKRATDVESNFIAAMSFYPQDVAHEIAGYCLKGLAEAPQVLDVGGGPLTFAVAFARKGALVTVLDLPQVIGMMKPKLDSDSNIEMIPGDFLKGLPEGPFDMIYLGNVCHIYGEKENRQLFRDAFKSLKEGGRLVINDLVRGSGPDAAVFAVNMLVNTPTGGTWSFEQYEEWLQDAGFSVFPWEDVADNELITALKK